MKLENIIGILTAVGTFGAVVVAMWSISQTNKNSKQQILVGKFEELFEVMQWLATYYEVFKLLYSKVMELRDQESREIRTRTEYFEVRDKFLSIDERDKIAIYLSRLDVLSECYAKNDLYEKTAVYKRLMFSFYDFAVNAGNLQQAIFFKDGFPNYTDFQLMVEDLKKEIILQIKLK